MVCQNRRMSKSLGLALLTALMAVGCASRDVQKDLQIVDVHTGWYDLGPIAAKPEQIKIVPGITIRLKNVSAEPIGGVELVAVFRDVNDEAVIDQHYVKAIASTAPLAAGDTTAPIVLKSQFGFTGPETRPQMFKNSRFIDKQVTILGKHGRNNWARMGIFPVDRASINR
jgi:hypothetical protein